MRSLIFLAAFFMAAAARADLICVASNVQSAPTNWNSSVTLPRFDPALGTLNGVDVCVTGQFDGTGRVESLDTFPGTINMQMAVVVTLTRPNSSVILIAIPIQNFTDSVSAYDGTIDFRGTSGVTHSGVTASVTTQVLLTNASDLALFTGSPANPGQITLPVVASNSSSATAPGHPITQFIMQASSMISICYDYTPVATSYCAGDGSGAACPCGNASAPGANAGCLNSLGTGGALRGAGVASIGGDSLVLSCSGLPDSATGLFFQGDAQTVGGAGAVFGDGLRCVGGTVARLAIKTAVSGLMTYPSAGDSSISVRGSVPANSVRHYQLWYRNSAGFCTNATHNLSQGVSVQWTP